MSKLVISKDNNNFNINVDSNLNLNGQCIVDKNGFLSSYPIGSIYLSVNDISPASTFGGTWELLKSNVSLILGGKAPVIGNGNALGMYYGNGNTFQTRGITQSSGVYEPLRTSTELDGSQKVGDSCGLSAFAPNTFLGISIDEDKSGIITNLSNAENRIKSIYIWKRTA